MEFPNKRTTNIDLLKYAEQYNMPLQILMNNEFKYPKNGFYILNLENNGQGGSHWTCLICQNKKCFYYDAFGAPPTEHVHLRLKQRYNKIYMNNSIIQDLSSNLCGWFSLGLLLHIHLHPKIELLKACDQFLNMFDDDTEKNNEILRHYLRSI